MSESIITKHCTKCNTTKPVSEFYRNRSNTDGLSCNCKMCHKAQIKAFTQTPYGRAAQCRHNHTEAARWARHQYKKSEKGKASARRYRQTESCKVAAQKQRRRPECKESMRRYRANNPLKQKARQMVASAVRRGDMPRASTLTCSVCNEPAKEYDHWHGYDEAHWLDVVPKCHWCHRHSSTSNIPVKPSTSRSIPQESQSVGT